MAIANTAKEEMIQQVAEIIVGKAAQGKKPRITAKELEAIARDFDWVGKDIENFTTYVKSPEGKEVFKKTIRMELWKAGYHPKEWEE